MFERFTDQARRVVVLAQEHARRRGNASIAPEHLALPLLVDDCGAYVRDVLERAGHDIDELAAAVKDALPPSESATASGHMPFQNETKRALEQSLRAALACGHNYIGAEHILLGLLRIDSDASTVFADAGVLYSAVEALLVEDAPPALPPRSEPFASVQWPVTARALAALLTAFPDAVIAVDGDHLVVVPPTPS